ncbi:T9SS type A sorting domain-containing protein [Jiulongibacter sp. NS-SX5]|uniref:T9SS type A sorting domain-containing protein n=1 Tax=Jiulongibacter sp. NS-SX5 TaxID=3463854 RepID=UPI004059D4C9
MKNLFVGVALFTAFAVGSNESLAQKSEDKIKIRVEKNINGNVEVIEKEIDATGMSEAQREAIMESLQDSLVGDMKGKKKVKIMIDDERRIDRLEDFDEEIEMEFDNEFNEAFEWHERDSPRVHMYKKRKGGPDGWDEFHYEMDRFGNEMKRLGEDIPRHLERQMPRVYAWTDDILREVMPSSTIRGLDVFPNKPDSEVVNVKFFAPEEGDVNITILDTKGNVVAKKESKNFKGEFVGQLELKKAEKGTYFVIVSQGEDGVTRRVVID